MTERYRAALEFATKKHAGQWRKGGAAYITHPVAVAEYLSQAGMDEDTQIAGLFHDLLEDTDATEDEILALGGSRVLEAVKAVTKQKGYVMADYVAEIMKNPMALEVKKADRLHNLRCAPQANEDFRRMYILETLDWYMDLSPEIRQAVHDLAKTLSQPISELSLYYQEHTWLQDCDNDSQKD